MGGGIPGAYHESCGEIDTLKRAGRGRMPLYTSSMVWDRLGR